MLKFFRTIRQRLISENKARNYLLYAIGEIILVVIGILIALQINNWNESQKLKQEETKLLNSLVKEIESNLVSIDTTIKDNEQMVQRSGEYLKNGLSDPEFKLSPRVIVSSLGYNTNKYQTSIINEILGTNSKSLISNETTITQLRELKQAYDRSDNTQFYADEFWNGKVTDFYSESGLGVYFAATDVEKFYTEDIALGKRYYSLLGMINGYQSSLLMSRQDLREALQSTLKYLSDKKNDN